MVNEVAHQLAFPQFPLAPPCQSSFYYSSSEVWDSPVRQHIITWFHLAGCGALLSTVLFETWYKTPEAGAYCVHTVSDVGALRPV
jgi:hypothetical protein